MQNSEAKKKIRTKLGKYKRPNRLCPHTQDNLVVSGYFISFVWLFCRLAELFSFGVSKTFWYAHDIPNCQIWIIAGFFFVCLQLTYIVLLHNDQDLWSLILFLIHLLLSSVAYAFFCSVCVALPFLTYFGVWKSRQLYYIHFVCTFRTTYK